MDSGNVFVFRRGDGESRSVCESKSCSGPSGAHGCCGPDNLEI